ncbi:MAG TPA: DUF3754 domain-containing protein [Thioploca sp.]|nr:MAG: hypothetical protein DRR19_22490 [Gammaproteobacteria bacterium]HDN26758.1 DUF3754 domain-containing protein [Thioploca sp.]
MPDDDLQTTDEPRERFIPISRQEIVADLLAAPHWSPEDKQQFEEFCQIFTALYHYKFHAHLEELKRCYTPFNPDSDIVSTHDYSKEEQQQLRDTLNEEMCQLLNNANYEEMTIDELNRAISADSFYGVNVSVDLEDFERLIVYYRGSAIEVKYVRDWKKLFLSQKPIEIPIYKRMFLLMKFKTQQELVQERVGNWLKDKADENQAKAEPVDEEKQAKLTAKLEKKATKQIQYSRQNLPEDLTEDHVFLKLFKNIPRTDLEMLFPNQNVQLKLFDKIKLAVTGGGGTIGGVISVFLKAASANIFMFVGAVFGLVGIIFRQIMSIFTQRTKYMMTLSRNLYFHNLDNNFGVMNYLIDMAEEEEGKEVILAYYFLHTMPEKNHTKEELDREIERYIQHKYGVAIDFEVDDGLRKLREEGVLTEQAGILKVLDLQKASACLDKQWDNFFNPDDGH